jgi:hypothetical protein
MKKYLDPQVIFIRLHIAIHNMKKFIIFLLKWISNNLAMPFWVVGHIHLSLNIYKDIYEILMYFGMNIIVGAGYW